MKKNISFIIQFIALAMFIVGIFACIICIIQAVKAGKGYYTRDPVAETLWYIGAAQSAIMAISSAFAVGFSYVVEAACKYIDRCNREEEEVVEE